MIKFIASAAAMLALGPTMAQPLDFKGVPFGSSREAFAIAHPSFNCRATRCTDGAKTPTYAGEPVKETIAIFVNDQLATVRVLFEPQSFEAILEALSSKYGKPAGDFDSVLQSRIGAKFNQREAVWLLDGGGQIGLMRFGTRVDQGALMLQSKHGSDDAAARDRTKSEAAKKDI